MSYVHCDNCDWGQDDFYSKSYNPITRIMDNLKWLWKPRIVTLDKWICTDQGYPYKENENGQAMIFSWKIFLYECRKCIRVYRAMRWKTRKAWIDDPDKLCPNCNQKVTNED